jgi:hypothetical protein
VIFSAAAGFALLLLRRVASLVGLPTLLLATVLATVLASAVLATLPASLAATLAAMLAATLLTLLRLTGISIAPRIALRLVALGTPLRGVAARHVSLLCAAVKYARLLNELPIATAD